MSGRSSIRWTRPLLAGTSWAPWELMGIDPGPRPIGKRPSELRWSRTAPVVQPPVVRERGCAHCGGDILKRPNGSRREFERKQFCGNMCSVKSRSAEAQGLAQPRTCEQCGQEYTKRAAESLNVYRARRFCSQDCTAASRPRMPIEVRRERQRLKMAARRARQKEQAS